MNYQEAVLMKQSFVTSLETFMARIDVIDNLELERIIARMLDNHGYDPESAVKIFFLRGLLKDRHDGVKRQAVLKRKLTLRRSQIEGFMRDVAKIEHQELARIHLQKEEELIRNYKLNCEEKKSEHKKVVMIDKREHDIALEKWEGAHKEWKQKSFFDRYFRSNEPIKPRFIESPLKLPILKRQPNLQSFDCYATNRLAETSQEDYLYYYICYFKIKHYELAIELFDLNI